MRKGSSEKPNQSENPWAIGTKSSKNTTFNRNDQEEGKGQGNKAKQHIPKLKERNPF